MDFNFTEEQKILKETARSFLAAECPSSFALEMEEDERGYTPELWQKMADLGWMGLIIPEEYGGVGGGFLDLIVMLEEMGRACLPGPFFSTVVFGATTILEGGSESHLKEYLPRIASGEMKLTLAHTEPGFTKYEPYHVEVSASPEAGDYLIEGTKLFVPDAHVADHMICVARTAGNKISREGISLFLVPAESLGLNWKGLKTIAGDKEFEVTFQDVKVPKDNVLGALNNGSTLLDKTLQKASICKCAEMLGGAQRVLEMASAYAKEREQFGKPIGSFQAVQHHCANMLIDIEGSRFITYKVAWMLSKDISCSKEVAIAKAWVGDAYKRIVGLGHQVLGATGYIVEHDMPLYSRKAKVGEMAFGDSTYCRQVIAQELGL